MILYFCKGLRPSIQVQLDNQRKNLDLWEEVVKKVINVKVKASFQLPSGIREINSRYPKGYRLTKKNKDKANWEHQNGDKTKSHNLSLANIS